MAIIDQGQSLIDMAVYHLGDASALMELAILNGISPTENLQASASLNLSAVKDPAMVDYLMYNFYTPATEQVFNGNIITLPDGIGNWSIGIDFEIS